MTLTPIQEAMCAVIAESGIHALRLCCNHVQYTASFRQWSVTVDNHTLTEQEYNEWVERNASKNCAD